MRCSEKTDHYGLVSGALWSVSHGPRRYWLCHHCFLVVAQKAENKRDAIEIAAFLVAGAFVNSFNEVCSRSLLIRDLNIYRTLGMTTGLEYGRARQSLHSAIHGAEVRWHVPYFIRRLPDKLSSLPARRSCWH